MKKNLRVDYNLLIVVDENGKEVFPFGEAHYKEILPQAILKELEHNQKIVHQAKEFLANFPTASDFISTLRNESELSEVILNDFYRNCFIVQVQSKMVYEITESIILKNFYNDIEAVKHLKQKLNYDNLLETYRSKSLAEIYNELKTA